MRSKAHTAPTAPLVLHRSKIDKCAMKKFGVNYFSLVKAAMNAPHICELRNAVNKMPQFLLFSIVKHCLKNRPHFTFYTEEATNAILYGAQVYALALRRYDVKLHEETV
jgi:hypothetical protein